MKLKSKCAGVAVVQDCPVFLDLNRSIEKASELIAEAEEAILCADLDFSLIPGQKWLFDEAGHYTRPDVFDFSGQTVRGVRAGLPGEDKKDDKTGFSTTQAIE